MVNTGKKNLIWLASPLQVARSTTCVNACFWIFRVWIPWVESRVSNPAPSVLLCNRVWLYNSDEHSSSIMDQPWLPRKCSMALCTCKLSLPIFSDSADHRKTPEVIHVVILAKFPLCLVFGKTWGRRCVPHLCDACQAQRGVVFASNQFFLNFMGIIKKIKKPSGGVKLLR